MPHGDVVDELHDHDGLAHAGAAEQPDLSTLHERSDQVNDLDAGLEHFGLGLEVDEFRRLPMDRPPFGRGRDRRTLVHRLAQDVEDAPERRVADGDRDRLALVHDFHPPHHPVGGAHRDRPHLVATDVLFDFEGDVHRGRAVPRIVHAQRVVELGQLLRLELHVDHRTDDLDDFPHVALRLGSVRLRLVLASRRHGKPQVSGAYPCSASAPPTISAISCVICACRARL